MVYRSIKNEQGWWIKSNEDGTECPLNSGLVNVFKKANVTTLCGAMEYGARTFGDLPCMESRELLSRERINSGGKLLEKLELGAYASRTYAQVQERIEKIRSNLPAFGIKQLSRVAIFAETRQEWFTGAMACLSNRVTVCTLYTTLNEVGLAHAINETEVEVVFTSYEQMPRLVLVLENCPKVKRLIIMEDQLEGIGTFEVPNDVTLTPFSHLLSKSGTDDTNSPAQASDIAIIMYTSGSTGTPKGVKLTHTNILCAVTGYSVQMNVGRGDRYLAFLPLAHIMELATEVALVSLGATIYYSSPHTLTSNSPKIRPGTKGDARLAKPTTMNSVPLVLDRIIKGVNKAVESQGWLKSLIFNGLVKYKFWLEYIPFTSGFLDYLIFNKVKQELGGELKRLIVGGAPLSPNTHDTVRAIFGCSIQVGYGSTETASTIAGMNEEDTSTGSVGGPNLGVFLRLRNWEEGGYLTTDQPYPRGEVIAGGDMIADGYYTETPETIGAFFEEHGERWFRTGDIGQMDDTGSLKIIDRMKDLVKLKHGEYVSLGNAESKLKTLPIVDNICVFADGTRERTVTVIVPIEDRLRKIATSVGGLTENSSMESLCSDQNVKKEVLKSLQKHGRKHGLSRWEIPADLYLAVEPWTPDSGLVTAALKLRRKQLGQRYQNMIREMYSRLDD